MTGVKGFTIRKWQERYKFFQPEMAKNGYWYYSNEDYILLSKVVNCLQKGEKISHIAAKGREAILALRGEDDYNDEEKKILRILQENRLTDLEIYLEEKFKTSNFSIFIRQYVESLIILIGRAWQDGFISVADEHNFSKWIAGYLRAKLQSRENTLTPQWLVAVYPGDMHELGALMHFALLKEKNIPAKFVGTLPKEHIIRELKRGEYKVLSLSMAMMQPMSKIMKLKETIIEKSGVSKVYIGGRGYQLSKYGTCREK